MRSIAGSEKLKKQKKWAVHYRSEDRDAEIAIREIAAGTRLSEMTARLLYIRGYRDAAAANRFLKMEMKWQ